MQTEFISATALMARVSEFDNAEIARQFIRALGMGLRAVAPEYNVTAWQGFNGYHWGPATV